MRGIAADTRMSVELESLELKENAHAPEIRGGLREVEVVRGEPTAPRLGATAVLFAAARVEPARGGSFFGGSAHAPRTRRVEGDGVVGVEAVPPPLAKTSATDILVVSRREPATGGMLCAVECVRHGMCEPMRSGGGGFMRAAGAMQGRR
jgi:hypothetical protein